MAPMNSADYESLSDSSRVRGNKRTIACEEVPNKWCPQVQAPPYQGASLEDLTRRESISNRTLYCWHEFPIQGRNNFDFRALFEHVMKKEGLAYCESALLKCHTCPENSRYGNLEFINADMASRALHLNQYPFLHPGEHENRIFLERPKSYAGAVFPQATWDDFKGEKQILQAAETKIEHERRVVGVKNLGQGVSCEELSQFMCQLVRKRFLNVLEGNPIRGCRVKDDATAFVTFRTPEEATATLKLETSEFRGEKLRFFKVKCDPLRNKKESFQGAPGLAATPMAAPEPTLMRRVPDGFKELQESIHSLRQELQESKKSRAILQDDLDQANNDLAEATRQLQRSGRIIVGLQKASREQQISFRLVEQELTKKKVELEKSNKELLETRQQQIVKLETTEKELAKTKRKLVEEQKRSQKIQREVELYTDQWIKSGQRIKNILGYGLDEAPPPQNILGSCKEDTRPPEFQVMVKPKTVASKIEFNVQPDTDAVKMEEEDTDWDV